ncbi:hypothetical protein SDRG_08744 [Saprolegnia diclina VS20]|uniref:Uncharacterized protein n=1 Tax=Saprolegnia diclina (strain VS20) TaxID=1156394 RepID=T0QIS9_SAPDV|nr:hypothetical protein SDRG_08744 [Saprolegnia diclina VS20]EQC33640.1 hypothetical protein SDRG_08744 [Saprolegnia diclina VS20]|eukprot:XP_008612863.1 hypothetical protein SDRG_08744 [Saprolegnia diclina VS20]
MDAKEAQRLWLAAGLPPDALSRLYLSGPPRFASAFRLSSAASISIGLASLAAAEIHHLRTGASRSSVTVDAQDACAEFLSHAVYKPDVTRPAPGVWDPLSGLYATNDGYVRLHANFPHHRDGLLGLLGLPLNAGRKNVEMALAAWQAEPFEALASERGLCAAAYRTSDAWQAHPMASHLDATYAANGHVPWRVQQHKAAATRTTHRPVWSHSGTTNCLSGVRVLCLTRVLAGPIAGRTLASHGADVLWVTSPQLPSLPSIDGDTSRGKRTIQLDLTTAKDASVLQDLVASADVFLDAYRPGALAAKGFGADDLFALNAHLVLGRCSAYGADGPWGGKRGFDSLLQTATGINADEAAAFGESAPRALPTQGLDHATGHLLAFGVLSALHAQLHGAGGSVVDVSLAWTAAWLRSLGAGDTTAAGLTPDEMAAATERVHLPTGITAQFAKRAPQMTPAPSFGQKYPTSLAHDEPVWLVRG